MQWHDWVAIGLIALLAWRAIHRARKLGQQGCGGGSCAGCSKAADCPSPSKKV